MQAPLVQPRIRSSWTRITNFRINHVVSQQVDRDGEDLDNRGIHAVGRERVFTEGFTDSVRRIRHTGDLTDVPAYVGYSLSRQTTRKCWLLRIVVKLTCQTTAEKTVSNPIDQLE